MMYETLKQFMEDDLGIYWNKKEMQRLHKFINQHITEVIGVDREIDYSSFDVNQEAELINEEKAKQRKRAEL